MLSMVIIGNLGRDAEVKEVNGQKVIQFSVAHTSSYTNAQGQKVQSTTWVKCDLWKEKDAISQYLKKGTLVYVEGFPKVYAYQNDQRQIVGNLQLKVQSVQLLGAAKKEGDAGTSSPAAGPVKAPPFGAEVENLGVADDLPF